MKKVFLLTASLILSLALFSQEIFIEQSLVINIEVPVRVFKGGEFIDNLSLDDFEVFEDSVLQKIDAVYLMKKRSIERSEEKKRFSPATSRNFFLNFEISDYSAKMGEALENFIQNALLPGDDLIVISPMTTYRLKSRALEVKSKEEIVEELKQLVRKDALEGSSDYKNTINEMIALSKSLTAVIKTGELDFMPDPGTGVEARETLPEQMDSFSSAQFGGLELDEQLIYYQGLLYKLEILRQVDQLKLLEFAKFLKNKEGQKYVFLFYQREFLPQIEPRILTEYISLYQERPDILSTLTGIMGFQRRDVSFDVEKVKQAYADSSISVHFLFITSPREILPGVYMQESSEDISSAFGEMASATGGFIDSSADPSSLFQKALEASENYYLLYYTPKNYKSDGTFKEIKVRLKNKDYRITHRAGYFAD